MMISKVETVDKNGRKKISLIKKNFLGKYYTSVKNIESVRVRFCKIYNNYVYPGAWSDNIKVKDHLVTWKLK